ncbi:MAG: pyrroline-5-carboxylate reductase [Candidatus Omnitrophota bacterium]
MIQKKSIGLIGCGNMGSALAENLKKKAQPKEIFVVDKDKERQESLVRRFGVKSCASVRELVSQSDVLILAVKPQDLQAVATDLRGISGKLIISIAAGVSLATLEEKISKKTALVRAMPNLNALIGRSVTALCPNRLADKEDVDVATEIFMAVGDVVFIQESQMNAFTAVAGSGPAFVAYMKDTKNDVLERILTQEAERLGLDHNTATTSAAGTIAGTREMMRVNLDPDILIKRVSSKGGTTEAGMKVLEEKGKTEQALSEAIQAAHRRANELAKIS